MAGAASPFQTHAERMTGETNDVPISSTAIIEAAPFLIAKETVSSAKLRVGASSANAQPMSSSDKGGRVRASRGELEMPRFARRSWSRLVAPTACTSKDVDSNGFALGAYGDVQR